MATVSSGVFTQRVVAESAVVLLGTVDEHLHHEILAAALFSPWP